MHAVNSVRVALVNLTGSDEFRNRGTCIINPINFRLHAQQNVETLYACSTAFGLVDQSCNVEYSARGRCTLTLDFPRGKPKHTSFTSTDETAEGLKLERRY